jgi:two-component system LytT family sensor kinase
MDSLVSDKTDSDPRPLRARWLQLGWPHFLVLTLLVGAYEGFNQLIANYQRYAFWKPFVWEISSALMILALIPLIVRFERRFRLDARPRGRTILIHITAAIVFSAAHTAGMVALRKLVYALAGDSYQFGSLFWSWFYELQKDVITYLIILIVIVAIREFQVRRAGELRAAQMAAELSEARLRHLTAQIEPHFLFNALNAISNRMHESVDAADRMISQLSDLLRAAYDNDHQLLVPLERELQWLRSYTAMMGERFRAQLTFELNVEPGLESVNVPRLLLQPIVENAFRHGLSSGHGWLSVRVERIGARLRYTISDDGVGVTGTPLKRGTGLSNVARRLELLFAEDHELTIAAGAPRGTVVTILFPVAA